MSLSRRRLFAALALVSLAPLAACSQPATVAAPAAASTPVARAASGAGAVPTASGEVVVYLPGAMATQSKALAAAFAASGATASIEVGHTPVQREQLAKGAAPDVWIAANPADMKSTAEAGLVVADKVQDLARTQLVVVVAPGNPGQVGTVQDLANPGVDVLLAAETLPIWMTTAKAFASIEAANPGFTEKVDANTVSREMGVQPIITKVTKGEADAGIVFVTDVGPDAETVAIPDELNARLTLSIAPVKAGKNPAGAEAFITFMTSGEGRTILDEAGYLPPSA